MLATLVTVYFQRKADRKESINHQKALSSFDNLGSMHCNPLPSGLTLVYYANADCTKCFITIKQLQDFYEKELATKATLLFILNSENRSLTDLNISKLQSATGCFLFDEYREYLNLISPLLEEGLVFLMDANRNIILKGNPLLDSDTASEYIQTALLP